MNLPKKNQKGFTPILLLILLLGLALILVSVFSKNLIITKLFPKPSPSAQTQVRSVIATPFVSANGTLLYVEGQPYQFTGFNAYSLATLWGTNAGCGGQENDLDGFFSSLRPNSVVRMWAFQGSMATNVNTKQIDWTALDRVVTSAQNHNQKLILGLSGQAGTCDDGHWKDKAWYLGGYTKSYNDDGNGLAPIPFLDYAKLVVDRYKNSTAIAMWELVSEPETADCQTGYKGDGCYGHQLCTDESAATQALRSFFDTVGGQIKSIDPNHLIESGVIGDGQCGAIFEDYSYIHQSPGVDVASFHDYGRDDQVMPGDIWNGLQKRLDQMKSIGKPLIVGEVGMLALDNSSNCISYFSRKDKIKAKMDAQIPAGVAGYLPWDLTGGTSPVCNFDIVNNDPLLALIHDYPVSMDIIGTTPSPLPSPIPTLTPIPTPLSTPSPVPSPISDSVPPSLPGNLQASVVSSSQINLTWDASTDNVGVVGYDIYRNNIYLSSITGTSFGDTKLSALTTYNYFVKAKDAAGNLSESSNQVSETTQPTQVLTGIISGIVYNSDGGVERGVKVFLGTNGVDKITYTNSLGYYTFSNLTAGKYNLTFQSKKAIKKTAIVFVTVGQTTTVNVTLQLR